MAQSQELLDLLGQLQVEVARDLLARIKSGSATASELNVARQLLKDNNIEATPSSNPPLFNIAKLPFKDPEEAYTQ